MIASPAPVLLCDLDGTLVDTVHDLAANLNRVLGESGLAPLATDQVRGCVGQGAARMVQRGFALAGRPLTPESADHEAALRRFLDLYGAAPIHHSAAYPGVAETLRRLRAAGWRLGVCSNKPQAPSEAILAGLGLADLFEAVAGGDRFPVRKPDGGHLRRTLAAMEAEDAPAVLVGDSRVDLDAARDAGLPVVLVTYGYGQEDVGTLGADGVIADFSVLPAVLASLRAPFNDEVRGR